jgi:hypothetical protein
MNGGKPKRYSESRPIRPFRISENGLRQCGFRVREDLDFVSEDPCTLLVESGEIRGPGFRPELKLAPDPEALASETGIEPDRLCLSVVLRDPALWRSERLAHWAVGEAPARYSIPETVRTRMSGLRGLEVSVQVTPSEPLEARFRTASKPGQIVADRTFRVSVPGEGAEFPVETVGPEYFEMLGLPRNTVWVVRWQTTVEFDRPPEEVLQVLLNREVAEKLLRLASADSVGKVLWTEIGTEILVELCLTVFGSDPEIPENDDGLLGKLYKRIQRVSGEDLDQLVSRAKSFPEGSRFFRAHLQDALELGRHISRINLAGRAY